MGRHERARRSVARGVRRRLSRRGARARLRRAEGRAQPRLRLAARLRGAGLAAGRRARLRALCARAFGHGKGGRRALFLRHDVAEIRRCDRAGAFGGGARPSGGSRAGACGFPARRGDRARKLARDLQRALLRLVPARHGGLHGARGLRGRSGYSARAHDAHGGSRAARRLHDDAGEGLAHARGGGAPSRAEGGQCLGHGHANERRPRHGLGSAHARRARGGRHAQECGRGAGVVERHRERRARAAAAPGSQGHHHREALFHPRGRARRSRQRAPEPAFRRLDQGRDGR